jgi:hypothetical protein
MANSQEVDLIDSRVAFENTLVELINADNFNDFSALAGKARGYLQILYVSSSQEEFKSLIDRYDFAYNQESRVFRR